MPSSCCTVSNICSQAGCGFFSNRVRATFTSYVELAMDADIADRRYLAPAVASPLFSFPVQEILGECNTNLACEFDQSIIFRPTTPPIKRIRSGLRD